MKLTEQSKSKYLGRLVASSLALLIVATTTPLAALALPEIPHYVDTAAPVAANVQVKTGPRSVHLIKPDQKFSTSATDTEITFSRAFQEPLLPMSTAPVTGENNALASAIKAFRGSPKTPGQMNLAPFENFLSDYPTSRWAPSVKLNVAQIKYHSGYLSQALKLFQEVWAQSKSETSRDKISVPNQAIASLLNTDARLGRKEELRKYLAEIDKRPFFGTDEQKVSAAREGLWNMDHIPERSFKCGPFAVESILSLNKTTTEVNPILDKAKSSPTGTTLAQVKDWADQVGLKYQAAKRAPGAPFIFPSVMHWKVDHFAAIVGQDNGLFHLKDPTFDSDGQVWVTGNALEQETDGYFLVPADKPLPGGWSAISQEEAAAVHGKGLASGRKEDDMDGGAPTEGSCPTEGMAVANAYSMLATLHIADIPLGYSPPVGPSIDFKIDYNHLQTNQPSTFTFTNLGQNWNFNWLSYLTVDSGTQVASVRKRGGGTMVFVPNAGVYSPDFLTQALLVDMGSGVYQLRMKDGSVEVYNQPDSSSPARIFLTQVIDPQGNSVFIQYDANFRITTITDSIGQVSTLTYVSNTLGNAGFYKIAAITDPFARSCSFAYDSSVSNLLSITDVISLKSSFQYDTSSSFISQMTTPYGTTSFLNYVPGVDVYPARGLRFTYPDGTSSVIENWIWETKSTYFWDRHAMAMYPNDPVNKVYTHCELMKWTIDKDTNQEASSTQWVTHPLESTSPIYMTYKNNNGSNYAGQNNLPLTLQRALGNLTVNCVITGTPTVGDVIGVQTDYVNANYTVQTGDTLAKIAIGLQNAINSSADYQTRGVVGGAINNVVSMRSEQNPSRRYSVHTNVGATETLTLLSQVRQSAVATLVGTITPGDTIYLYPEYPNRINFAYTVQPGDTAATICTNMASVMNANATWVNYGGVATPSGNKINLVCYSPEEQLYSAGTTGTEAFEYSSYRSGSAQLTENQYNTVGNLTQTIDPMRRTFSYSYAANGIDLLEKRETQGSDNYLLGHWEYNANHQPLVYIDGSAQRTEYTYNSSGQLLTTKDANNNVTTNTYTGTSKATVGGTVTAGNVLTITVYDTGLSGGSKAVNYTVLSGATLTTIATGIKNAISADAALAAIGLTATSSGAVVTLSSTSVNVTTYISSVSGGATETLTMGANTWGYLTKVDGPLAGSQDKTTITYDTYGRVATTTSSTGYTLSYLYDAMNRPLRTTYPDGTYEQNIYDKLDVVLSRDRNGRWTQSTYDSLGQLSYEVDPLGRKTQYDWCSCGSLAILTDPLGRQTSWAHDIEGRLTTKTYPDSSTCSYAYEEKTSNVKQRTDALGQRTNYLYYPDDRKFISIYPNPVNPTGTSATFWDYNYNRQVRVSKNDWGNIDYTYNNYVTSSTDAPITGGGRLQLVHNDRMANSDITFLYDSLGRTTNQSVNGAANSDTLSYDAMSRVTGETNALGSFAYAYVDDTSGSSKGVSRLASVTYPNSQVTKYSWYPTTGDERLQQISNLKTSSGPTISQFSHRYDPAGQMTQWQQLQGNSSVNLNLGYDQVSQLTSSQAGSGGPSPAYLGQNYFAYDSASNRTGVQQNSINRVRLGGIVTTGNTLTITVKDSSLSGGQQAITYTVVGGDTLSTIATKLAAAITANANLQAIGVNASANGAVMGIKSASPNITSYAQSTSGGATETISLGVTNNFVENAVIGGTKTTGNTLTITVMDAALSGGSTAITYTVLAGDTLTTMATGLKNAINANAGLATAGITATSAGTAITIKSTSSNATTYSQSTSSGATATMALSVNQNGPQTIAINGTKTTGDVLTLTVYDSGLAGGLEAVTYTVLAGDTLTSIASGLASAVAADANLQTIGVGASSVGQVISLQSNSINQTSLRASTSSGATELIALNIPVNGVQTAVIGGAKTTGNVLTVTTYDSGLSGGSQAVTYTVLAGDTLTSIATGLAAAINANANLAAIGVTATSSSTVVSIKSASINNTTYTKALSGGATETIVLAPSTSATQYSYNNLNELTAIAAGGATKFEGLANKALKSATVNGNAASLNWSQSFSGNASLSNSANSVPVSATEGASNVVTNNYQIGVNGPGSSSLTFDANGNMTSDGTKSYAWDAEDRLIKIDYPGSGNSTFFYYDAHHVLSQIEELSGGVVTKTRVFVRSGSRICEERDTSNSVIQRFFARGQVISGSNYFATYDHLGSVRDVVNSAGILAAQYNYSILGSVVKTFGSVDYDFQYAGYYFHRPSGFNITLTRFYDASIGRWFTRDPIREKGGANIYAYVKNMLPNSIDPSGLERVILTLPPLKRGNPLRYGCNGLCGQRQGLGADPPESAPNTHCYLTKAQAEQQCPCAKPFVFGIQGTPSRGQLEPDSSGAVPNDSLDTVDNANLNPYNYLTPMEDGSGRYMGIDHAAWDRNHNPQTQHMWQGDPIPLNETDYPAEIWCVTCRGK